MIDSVMDLGQSFRLSYLEMAEIEMERLGLQSLTSPILRLVGALGMVGVVHAFMVVFKVPSSAAWYLGAIIYAGLVAVLVARRPLADKMGIYFVFVVATVVGALTVCPCTGAHFFLAPLAGLLAVGLVHRIKQRTRLD